MNQFLQLRNQTIIAIINKIILFCTVLFVLTTAPLLFCTVLFVLTTAPLLFCTVLFVLTTAPLSDFAVILQVDQECCFIIPNVIVVINYIVKLIRLLPGTLYSWSVLFPDFGHRGSQPIQNWGCSCIGALETRADIKLLWYKVKSNEITSVDV